MTDKILPSQLDRLPRTPGVYFFWSEQNDLLYVGKAKVLFKRVSQYFQGGGHNQKTMAMVSQIHSISTISTGTEHEALLLENEKIKQHKPKYNILLKDDKSFPYLVLSKHAFPRITASRGKKNNQGHFYGPFTQVKNLRGVIESLQGLFKVRNCTDTMFKHRTRPCLLYQINRCSGPCVGLISEKDYAQSVKALADCLEGKNDELIEASMQAMQAAAASQDYELAAYHRDRITAIQKMRWQDQGKPRGTDLDIAASEPVPGGTLLQISVIRNESLVESKSVFVDQVVDVEMHVLPQFLLEYYRQTYLFYGKPVQVIMVGLDIKPWSALFLKEGIRLKKPESSVAYQSAVNNCNLNLQAALKKRAIQTCKHQKALDVIAERFGQAGWTTIECIDISHTFGQYTRASCVRLQAQGPDKSSYRAYHVPVANDDYEAMRWLANKRYKKLATENNQADCLLIDGGKGQLSAISEVLGQQQLSLPCLAISKGEKRRDGLETYHRLSEDGKRSLVVEVPDEVRRSLELIRNEAHRFALKHHRRSRSKAMVKSELLDIPGLGPVIHKRLLMSFGGESGLKQVSLKQLCGIKGVSLNLAEKIHDYYQRS